MTGKLFILIGLMLMVIGIVIAYVPGLVNWFGKLPGDIRYETKTGFIYFPVTSMIIVSVVLSILGTFLLKR